MRNILVILLAASMFGAFTSYDIASAQGKAEEAETVKEGEVINDICPVMGHEVAEDTSSKIEYEGKIIGLCCSNCIDEFKADPEKYMAKLKKKKSTD